MAIVDIEYEKWQKDFEDEFPDLFKGGSLTGPVTALRRDLMRTAYMAGKKASRQPVGAQGIDLGPLRRLYQAYVRLLESGRDRITDLGGTCDQVDDMERKDPYLIEARNLLGIKIDGRDAGAGVGS